MKIDVNEIFGPTFQGEGSSAGQHCLFVRLAHCNLECSWCDTPYTWAFTSPKMDKHKSSEARGGQPYDKAVEVHPMDLDDILEKLEDLWPIYTLPTIVVISGGEPLMQGQQLGYLTRELHNIDCPVHIETAGTLLPPENLNRHVSQYVVSPKLAHSGNVLTKRRKLNVLSWFASHDKAWFKFVLQSRADFDEVDEIVKEAGIDPSRVMVMPEGTTVVQLLATAKEIKGDALERGFGLSMRQHIELWPSVERGI